MEPTQLPLRDIHLPTAIGWWPPAPGWWIVAGLIILAVFAILLFLRRLRRRSVKKTAAKRLALLRQTKMPVKEKISNLSALLRRIAITAYPRDNTASLTGKAWLQFLDTPLNSHDFSQGDGLRLLDAPYRPDGSDESPKDLEALFNLCERWIKALPAEKSCREEKR